MPPSRERGFKPELLYQFGSFDNVALFNGNLTATIPLGSSYPVGAGLSYAFVLRYSGNVWSDVDSCGGKDGDRCHMFKRPLRENGGMGWRLSFGDLRPAVTGAIAGTALSMWGYKSPDGSEHLFYPMLHEPFCSAQVTTDCDPYDASVSYTRDGTYLRMKDYGTYRVIEFPNGERHRFEPHTDSHWRLRYIYNTFSALDAAGVPTATSNWVRFDYVPSGTAGLDDSWTITDTHGRAHYVTFVENSDVVDLVSSVDLEAFRGASQDARVSAMYTLAYTVIPELPEPCLSQVPTTTANAAFLDTVTFPSGEKHTFTYETAPAGDCYTGQTAREKSGTLLSATLPTGGKITYTYQIFDFNGGFNQAVGVETRKVQEDQVETQYTGYAVTSGLTTVTNYVKQSGTWVADDKTFYYAQWNPQTTEFALPYTTAATQNGRYLSSQTFDCDSGTCPTTPAREKYVTYDRDAMGSCNVDHPCMRDRNRRVSGELIKYLDDGNITADTAYDHFDGLGHYRQTRTTGTFTPGYTHESYVGYNPDLGDYQRAGDARVPGYSMLPSTSPWILWMYDTSSEKDVGTGQKAIVNACFAPTTGFLLRRRRLNGATIGSSDLITAYTLDPNGSGYPATEESFGGGKNAAPTDAGWCTSALTHDAYTYAIDHTFQWGALATSRYRDVHSGSTTATMPFFSVNDVPDRGTGLPYQSKDSAGLTTTYQFDSSGRLAGVTPPGLTATTYTYSAATSTQYAKVTAQTGTGADRIATEYQFDRLGRLSREQKLMPGAIWSVRETLYDSAGRRLSVSEAGSGAPSTALTLFQNYDVFGRVGRVTTADGKETAYAYTGNRLTKRTSNVATDTGGGSNVSVMEELDRAGRLSKVTENYGGSSPVVTEYKYDVANRLVEVGVDATATPQKRFFTYGLNGLLSSETHPESGTTSYEYDARGNVVTRTTPVAAVTFVYDSAGRVTAVQDQGQTTKEFTYEAGETSPELGKLKTAVRHHRDTALGSDVTVTETFTYSPSHGRLLEKQTSTNLGETFVDKYETDSFGQLQKITYPSCQACTAPPARTVTNAYWNGFLTGVSGYTPLSDGITYHPNGMVASIRDLNSDGSLGPRYTQALDSAGMPRPSSMSVDTFCADLSITSSPANKTVQSGQPAGLTVGASGATSFEWFEGNSTIAIAGEYTSTLGKSVTHTTTFWARAHNGSCTVDSRAATVTVAGSTTAPPAPTSVIATAASGTSVTVTWQYGSTADRFDVYRNGVSIGSVSSGSPLSYTDHGATTATAYLYEVQAVKDGQASVSNPFDLATTVVQPNVAAGVEVALDHVTKLQSAVNAVRGLAGLPAFAFSPTPVQFGDVQAIQLQQLREALDPARAALQLPPAVYTRSVAQGDEIRAADLTDLQKGVK